MRGTTRPHNRLLLSEMSGEDLIDPAGVADDCRRRAAGVDPGTNTRRDGTGC